MSCYDCIVGAKERVKTFVKSGGTRRYLPAPCGFSIATIVEVSEKTGDLKLRDMQGREWETSPCRIPLQAFAGVA